MEPLMRLREYCETAACPRSGEFATEAPHFDFSSSALRQHRSAPTNRFRFMGTAKPLPAPERGFLHGLTSVESREGDKALIVPGAGPSRLLNDKATGFSREGD